MDKHLFLHTHMNRTPPHFFCYSILQTSSTSEPKINLAVVMFAHVGLEFEDLCTDLVAQLTGYCSSVI